MGVVVLIMATREEAVGVKEQIAMRTVELEVRESEVRRREMDLESERERLELAPLELSRAELEEALAPTLLRVSGRVAGSERARLRGRSTLRKRGAVTRSELGNEVREANIVLCSPPPT